MPEERIELVIDVDETGAIKGLKKVGKVSDRIADQTEKKAKKQISTFGRMKGALSKLSLGYAALGAVITGTVVAGMTKIIRSASDAEETFSKFGTVFKDVTGEAETAARNLADSYGLSSIKAKQLLSDTGDLLSGFGFTGKAALDLSTEVQELAVDLASFTNFAGGAKGASDALTKALLGERESVKSLGIAILESDVKAKVLQMTQEGLTFETERQAKAYATLALAQEQSKNAIGDFARTQHQLANSFRIFGSRIEERIVQLGTRFLPITNKIVKGLIGFVSQEKNLSGTTSDLIKIQSEYTDVVRRLAEEQGTLSEEERKSLQVRKGMLQIELVKSLAEANRQYMKQRQAVIEAFTESFRYNELLDELKDSVAAAVEANKDYIRITPEMASAFELVTDRSNTWERGIVRLTEVQRRMSDVTEISAKRKEQLATSQAVLDDATEQYAKALNDNVLTERELIGLNPTFRAQILDLAKSLREKATATREDAEETTSSFNATQQQVGTIQKLKDELRELGLMEEEVRLRRNETAEAYIDRLNLLTEEMREVWELANEEQFLSEQQLQERRIELISNTLEHKKLSTEAEQKLSDALAKHEVKLAEMITKKTKAERDKQLKIIQTFTADVASTTQAAYDLTTDLLFRETAIHKQEHKNRAKAARTLFGVLKLARIAEAIANTAVAVTAALTIPPPLGEAIAATRKIKGGLQVAAIIAEQPPNIPEFKEGGTVSGYGGPDSQLVRATPGETMISPRQGVNLFNALESAGLLSPHAGRTVNNYDQSRVDSSRMINIEGATFVMEGVSDKEEFREWLLEFAEERGTTI